MLKTFQAPAVPAYGFPAYGARDDLLRIEFPLALSAGTPRFDSPHRHPTAQGLFP